MRPIQHLSRSLVVALAASAVLSACGTTHPNPELEGRENMWVGEAFRNASLKNAIVAQHTLYPYHFVTGSAVLNDLGERDLDVLSVHFTEASGDLNVRRGQAAQALYEARVKAVLDHLAAAGVPTNSVAIKDGLPGGDGISSERVIVILKEKMSKDENAFGDIGGGNSGGDMGGGALVQ